MTNGPDAELAEIIEIDIPRPRTRASLIDHPRYLELRNYVLRFLVQGAKKRPSAAGRNTTDMTNGPDRANPANPTPLAVV
jgi:nitrate/nitrite transport system ATP-binding protein